MAQFVYHENDEEMWIEIDTNRIKAEIDKILEENNSCSTCLRQGCEYKNETIRVNCPLYRRSAV